MQREKSVALADWKIPLDTMLVPFCLFFCVCVFFSVRTAVLGDFAADLI